MTGARVFVRLYDSATEREGPGELLMLPPPPLTWNGVLSMMIMAVTKQENEPDADAIKRARLFLLPTDAQGIVAELNARALRFGVRDNDQFAICLNGEEYKKPTDAAAETEAPVTDGAHEQSAVAALTTMATTTRLNDYDQYNAASVSASAPAPSNGPPRGNIMGMSGSRKTTKRYRSISGKMAAIKSLGDQGLITAEDRGHLKDLLLNNDSPALQEALENYQNTGDFHAVKELLVKELRNPSAKRPTGDWLPESLINELSENFQTHDDNDQDDTERPSYSAQYNQQNASNGYATYGNASTPYNQSSVTSDYSTMASTSQEYESQSQGSVSWNTPQAAASTPTNNVYGQQQTMGVQPYATTPTAQINLPLRNRNSVNLMQKHPGMDESQMTPQQQQQAAMLHGNPVEIGYATPHATAYAMQPQGYAMGYAPATAGDYSRMGMNAYYAQQVQTPMAYSPYPQQTAFAYGMAPYGQQGYAQMGYDYYGAGMGYGYLKGGAFGGRMSGKWTTAPPMPAYPPACSPEEKKEKIARWLKKRENRNWSNKPSYPVRHNIAKNRKRGEDGRFITKKRLAEMEAEEKARAAAGLPPLHASTEGQDEFDPEVDGDENSGSDRDSATMPLGVLGNDVFAGLPAPVQT